MADWSKSMQQTFEFYTVNPESWRDVKKLTNIVRCNITWDSEQETLGSATFDTIDSIEEGYVRVYMITNQNGVKEKHPLGTFLVQTPSSSFDGKVKSVSADAYTPLLELKEKSPPIGFYIPKDADIMENVYDLMKDNMRGPVVEPVTPSTKLNDAFVADNNDTWLTFLTELISASKTVTHNKVERDEAGLYIKLPEEITVPENIIPTEVSEKTDANDTIYTFTHEGVTQYFTTTEGITRYRLALDEIGNVMFEPVLDVDQMVPVWTYNDDNSSILYPDISVDHDLYGIPNVVEVIYDDKDNYLISEKVNDDPRSPVSTVARGRRIMHRVMNPSLHGKVTQEILDKYAEELLATLSSIECSVTYTHGYCPVRVGDCVRLNYTRAGLNNVKAKVISQSITCSTGCSVSEKAVFISKLWG